MKSLRVQGVEVAGVSLVGQHALKAFAREGVRVAGGLGDVHG